mgnify:CR=1 FL=1
MIVKALLSPAGLVKSSKKQNGLIVDRHAHSQITGSPDTFGVQVDHFPVVLINVIHLNRVCDLLLLKLGPSREDIDVL